MRKSRGSDEMAGRTWKDRTKDREMARETRRKRYDENGIMAEKHRSTRFAWRRPCSGVSVSAAVTFILMTHAAINNNHASIS